MPQPKQNNEGRKWFTISAKAGIGEVHIFDYIDPVGVNARTFQKELAAIGDVHTIKVHINSPGGDVFEGNTIYNLLKGHKAQVTVYVDGLAASIASVIAMAGDKIVMPANAMMMIHDPWTFAVGNAEDMRKTADTLEKISKTLVASYQSKSGLNENEIKSIMADETWYSADDALAMGFADEVVGAIRFDASIDSIEYLNKFKNCPPGFRAQLAAAAAARDRGTTRDDPGEHQQENHMNRTQILAFAVAIGLVATASEVTALADKLVTDKADFDKVSAELQALKTKIEKPKVEDAPKALTADEIEAASARGAEKILAADRKRATDIRAAAEKLKVAGNKEIDTLVLAMIADGTTVADAREKIFNAVAEMQEKGSVIFGGNTKTMDNPEFARETMAAAVAGRYSAKVRKDMKADAPERAFMQHSIIDIAAEMLRAQGHRITGRDKVAIIRAALHTTSDFPYLLADAANKMLMPEYAAANPTYRIWAAEKTFNDFKPHKFNRLGDFPDLLEVGESGEVKRGTISENKETVTLGTFGRILGLTRQALINDDLSAFADLTMKAGRRVAMWENGLVYAQLLLNSALGPTLTDGLSLFHATHANYTSSGTAVNLPKELGLSRQKMRDQTGLDGLKLNLSPKFLLVGTANETAAEQVTVAVTPALTSSVNRVGPSLTPVVDSNISGTKWYLSADPSDAETIVFGSLAGQTGPRVETRQGWDIEGVELKVMRDFVAGAVDYRGMTLNTGTTPS